MIKKIVISLVFLILLVGGGLFYYFDSIVKSGVEVVGTQVLGSEVSVESVSVSPLNGMGSISGLSIANPEGFDSDYAFQLEEMSVVLNTSTVFEDVLVIDSITIVQPQITYETRIVSDNIRALIENISSDSSGSSAAESSTESGGRRIVIREFRMLDPQLNLVAAVVNAPFQLPDVELNDIGAEDNSTTVSDALRLILSTLSRSILSSNLPSIDDLRNEVEGRLQDGVEALESRLDNSVEDAAEEVTDRLHSILN
ncbi:MAG: hypothetical protein GKR91_11020 [Pseudomonadales bacterium]|nr:hypothetical protein [Pseudomonadales bacterium]